MAIGGPALRELHGILENLGFWKRSCKIGWSWSITPENSQTWNRFSKTPGSGHRKRWTKRFQKVDKRTLGGDPNSFHLGPLAGP